MILLHTAQHIVQVVPHVTTLLPLACNPGNGDDVGNMLNKLAGSIQNDARIVGFTVFIIAVIIAGIMRMVAFGSERRVALSNMALTAAVVGLGILLLAPVIQTALGNMLGCGV
ncbi:MAG TPA: hypothetical protein VKR06_40585 [Ktedonosporobacter sp.]|nr:hypothetical protein [Ktedonosporobacter sp.]